MTTEKIDKQDVTNFARSIGKSITDKQAEFIVQQYPDWQAIDPLATWNSIVEDLIYFTIESGTFDQLGYEQTSEE